VHGRALDGNQHKNKLIVIEMKMTPWICGKTGNIELEITLEIVR